MKKKGQRGFTMIELVLVITLLGILAVVAIPQFFNLRTNAQQSARDGVVGAVRSGVAVWRANDMVTGGTGAPPDAATFGGTAGADCVAATPCFDGVLENAVTDGNWTMNADGTYTHTPTATTYTYTAATGTFE